MNLTIEGTPESERRARDILAYCALATDFALWCAVDQWRWRHITNNPFGKARP